MKIHKQGGLIQKDDISLWTDGGFSFAKGKSSIGCCISINNEPPIELCRDSFAPSNSSYHAESLALKHGLFELNQFYKVANKSVGVYLDSRSLVQHLKKIRRESGLVSNTVNEILKGFKMLFVSKAQHISVTWVPGHKNVGYNEVSDEIASRALKNTIPRDCQVPASYLIGHFRRQRKQAMKSYLVSTIVESADKENSPRKKFYVQRYFKTPDHELQINRKVEISIARLRSGHTLLRGVMNRFDKDLDPRCERCKLDVETIQHVLLDCEKISVKSQGYRRTVKRILDVSGFALRQFLVSLNPRHFKALADLVENLIADNVRF